MNAYRRRVLVFAGLLGSAVLLAGWTCAQELLPAPRLIRDADKDPLAALACPEPAPGDKPLPINLATALHLANAQAWDIQIAQEQIEIAAAELEGARVLWVPSIFGGVDYQHHDGPIQEVPGDVINISRSSLFVGGAPQAIFSLSDAIFLPLAARQEVVARQANLQAVTNDVVLAVAEAYFNVEEATGQLAAAEDVVRRSNALIAKIDKLAPGIVPRVELARARTQLARFEQTARSARERWQVEGAELVRIIRLTPDTLVQPVEPPNLQITLINPHSTTEQMVDLAVVNRPELAADQALVREAVQHLRDERFRPLLPNLILRGGGTTPPYPMMYGAFGGGGGSTLNNFGTGRADYDVEAIWELRNLGFGNHALIRQRRAERDLFQMQLYRERDLVARQAVQALAQVQSALTRALEAERGLREGLISYTQNFQGLGEIKRVGGEINILVIRPQEVDAALQDLITAYFDYFATVADYNRAQFRLYWAIGNPGQMLADPNGLGNGCYNKGGPPEPLPADPNGCTTGSPAAVPAGFDKCGEPAQHH